MKAFSIMLVQLFSLLALASRLPIEQPFDSIREISRENDVFVKTSTMLNVDAFGPPSCVSWELGRVDCFVRNRHSQANHISISIGDQRGYSRWLNLGGTLTSEIESICRNVNNIDIFVLMASNKLWVRSYVSGEWNPWKETELSFLEEPGCMSRFAGHIDCLGRKIDNSACNCWRTADGWSKECDPHGGSLSTGISCVSKDYVNINCFATGTDNQLYGFNWHNLRGGWQKILKLGGAIKGKPCVISWSGARLDVFALGEKNDIVHLSWTLSGSWTAWESLEGEFDSDPSCITANGTNRLLCFAVGEQSRLFRNSYNGHVWSGWVVDLPLYAFLEAPSCVVSDVAEISCYARLASRSLLEMVYAF